VIDEEFIEMRNSSRHLRIGIRNSNIKPFWKCNLLRSSLVMMSLSNCFKISALELRPHTNYLDPKSDFRERDLFAGKGRLSEGATVRIAHHILFYTLGFYLCSCLGSIHL
jgi:hypothetical protein